jgi:hypothetical protein
LQFLSVGKISDNIERLHDGSILCKGVALTRAGDFLYAPGELRSLTGGRLNDSTAEIFTTVRRTVDDIHDPKTILSFQGAPITIGHPDSLITPDNRRHVLTVGEVLNPRPGTGQDADKLLGDLHITDREAIDAVAPPDGGEPKLREVSCGYRFQYQQVGRGFGRQTDILGNHLALVPRGRCGAECAIRDTGEELAMKTTTDPTPGFLARLRAAVGGEAVDKAIAEDQAAAAAAADAAAKNQAPAWFLAAMDKINDRFVAIEAKAPAAPAATTGDAPFGGGAPATPPAAPNPPAADPAKDAGPTLASIGEQLATVIAFCAKMLDKMAPEGEAPETPMATDKAGNVCTDAATIALAEILVPGIAKTKDVASRALDAAYATPAGRAVIEAVLDSAGTTFEACDREATFKAAANMTRVVRTAELAARAGASTADAAAKAAARAEDSGPMTAARQQELMDRHYADQQNGAIH